MNRRTVLVTGSAGTMGRQVVEALLEAGHHVRGIDLRPTPGLENAFVGNLQDSQTFGAAMEGVEVVVHLAATPDEADFLSELLPNNIVGVYHVFDQARRQKVQRLIFASSTQVVWGLLEEGTRLPVRVDDPYAPRTHYAAAKIFAEAMGQLYSSRYGLQVVAVRPGWMPRNPEHAASGIRHPIVRDLYLSPRDAGRFFRLAVEAEELPPYCVLYAASITRRTLIDLEPAERLIGYRPKDRYPEGIPFSVPEAPPDAV
ncbi:MAG: NAD-dependent dehydratase [Candidatus Poribacteria bacterium]|nr:MAG: NAD-dependent dehydratase [Candidatus Poribacteria bacterium]